MTDFIRIRDRPLLNPSNTNSDTLYVRGISRNVKSFELQNLLSVVECPVEVDFSTREDSVKHAGISGQVWAKYSTTEAAKKTMLKLHNYYFFGVYLSVKFEFGIDPITNVRILDNTNFHSNVIRCIAKRNSNNKTNISNKFDYSSKSIVVNNTDYPFPTGLYLTRIIQLISKYAMLMPINEGDTYCKSLMKLVTSSMLFTNNMGNNQSYAKEITEGMSMVDAIERVLKQCDWMNYAIDTCTSKVHVFVLGDGIYPLCAALIALHFKYNHWEYYSIDPILQPISIDDELDNNLKNSFHQFVGLSQDFVLPRMSNDDIMIIVACHSHAPLQEFWDRPVSCKKIAISMNCCANYCILYNSCNDCHSGKKPLLDPLIVFDDFEVYSPKRTVRIYVDNA